MDTGNGRRVLPYAAIIVLVAVLAFGAGALASFGVTQLRDQGQPASTAATSPAKIISIAEGTATVSSDGSGQTAAGSSADPTLANTPSIAQDNGTQGDGTAPDTNPPGAPQNLEKEFKPFWNTLQAVDSEFYGRPVDHQKMIYAATKGMMQSLGDNFSTFLTPDENKSVQSQMAGNFEGVGMYFEKRNDLPTVIGPIPNTPAEQAGLRANDVILAVDGRDITKMTTDQISTLIRGPKGTQVRLTIKRGTQPPFDVTLKRAQIDVPAVTLKWQENNIADIEVSIFGDKTTAQLDKALNEAIAKKASGIVLDLRNNGGGWVVSAQEMLGRFLPAGSVAFYESHKRDHSDDRPQNVIVNGPKVPANIPMVVLTNGGTASASELVSGALQDYGRAKLIGEQSFGKGSEQHVHNWDDGSSARITFAHWLTPKKRDINPRPSPTAQANGSPIPLPTFTPTAVATVAPANATATAGAQPLVQSQTDRGLTPDIVVVRTEKDYEDQKDPQLDRALGYLKTGK